MNGRQAPSFNSTWRTPFPAESATLFLFFNGYLPRLYRHRDHPATDVHVTGTFDDWGETIRLEKKDGNRFEKLVELPDAEQKIYYKVGEL